MSEQQRGRRAIEAGPTGKTVGENLARLRKVRGLTTRQLSGLLEKNGRPIPASGITRMEKAERQVVVDELVALAAALRVSPSALLLPLTDDPSVSVDLTGAGTVDAATAWDWLDGVAPLKATAGDDTTDALDHALYSRPPGRRDQSVASGALRNLSALKDPAARNALEQLTGMSVGEPQPLPEKYRKARED
ncbi:helix-turn-helix domain-containing protein [Streptomyces pristinaespiralis]|uniref:helix-turn-helix domain-containing protein n=1 Tax=Streptomyces pristinaespiralis TaxID=38300 RepID=UPI00383994B3